MDKELLARFTSPKHSLMSAPFSWGDYSYATNGHILVRVPRLKDVPEWEALNDKAAALFDGLNFPQLKAALTEIPDFSQPVPVPCPACNGTGKLSICPECDGSGVVTFENDYNEYNCDCESCNGAGKISGSDYECHFCNGTGEKPYFKRIAIGCSGFSSYYLKLMRDFLPGIKIAPTDPKKLNYFEWDGGDGLLMPMIATHL